MDWRLGPGRTERAPYRAKTLASDLTSAPLNISSPPPSDITLELFIRTLFSSGEARVPAYSPAAPDGGIGWDTLVNELDAARRAELGPQSPPLDAVATKWAAERLFRACQFLVCREVTAEVVTRFMSERWPAPYSPSAAYSVDLVMWVLPDLFALAQPLAPEDPLVSGLREWAQQWPLSSVGIAIRPISSDYESLDNPALQRLFADRVTALRASDRLGDPQLRARLRTDAGLYPELIPFPPSAYEHI